MASAIRYTEDQKKEALRAYVDYGRNLVKTADETGIPYNSMRPWVASNWGKIFMANYELETKGELVAGATKDVLDMKVEHFKIETDFINETEQIMGRVIKRINEVLGQEKNIKNLTELLKTLYDVMAQFRSKSDSTHGGELLSDKARMIVDLIDKQMNVTPEAIKKYQPMKKADDFKISTRR